MKKLIIFLLFICSLYIQKPTVQYAFASTKYARIETTTQIYKTTSGSEIIDNILCLAEESYFVEILGIYDDFYRINYNSIIGYVKKNDVKEISNTPSTPYPYNIKIIISSNCNLRSTPTTQSNTNNIISTVYKNTKDIVFIGRAIGEEAIDFGGSTWYYVCYQGNYGYIYNNYVQSVTPIYKNNEEYSYAKPIINKIEKPITHTPSLIIIVILSIPLFGILLILYLPKKHKHTKKINKKPKVIEKY